MKKIDSIGRVSKKETKSCKGNAVMLSKRERKRIVAEAEMKLAEIKEKYKDENVIRVRNEVGEDLCSVVGCHKKNCDEIKNVFLNGHKLIPEDMPRMDKTILCSMQMRETNAVIEDFAFEQLCDLIGSYLSYFKKCSKCSKKVGAVKFEPLSPIAEFHEHWDEIMSVLPTDVREKIILNLNRRRVSRNANRLGVIAKLRHLIFFCTRRKEVRKVFDVDLEEVKYINYVLQYV